MIDRIIAALATQALERRRNWAQRRLDTLPHGAERDQRAEEAAVRLAPWCTIVTLAGGRVPEETHPLPVSPTEALAALAVERDAAILAAEEAQAAARADPMRSGELDHRGQARVREARELMRLAWALGAPPMNPQLDRSPVQALAA